MAALLTFGRPECSLGGEGGLEVRVHPLEDFGGNKQPHEAKLEASTKNLDVDTSFIQLAKSGGQSTGMKTLKDALKLKSKRKKKASSALDGS